MEDKNHIQIPKSETGFTRTSGLSGSYNHPLSHEAGCSVIQEAFGMGVTFFDTSDLYGENHDNEIMLGKALKQLPREKVQLATKFGVKTIEGGQLEVKGTPEYVRQCCEASLKRLELDYIDLYYQHRVDVSVPIEDTVGELKKLVEGGKIKYIGLSEASADTIRRAYSVHPITAVQVEYSLWTRDIKEDIMPLCRAPSHFPSKLTSALHLPMRVNLVLKTKAHFPRFTGENLEKNKQLYASVADLAFKHNCTPPQLALAWLLHQEDNIVPIPGTTKVKNLHNNIGSLAVKLNKEDLKGISNAVPIDEVAGNKDSDYTQQYSYKFANTPEKIVK
ncbi:NAD(P)-linked oxidoreductase superfamily protein [Actinidia rufa]|uniref:NAD(P)-linked oxidoreductase superfamily protein n=1 Tax=Actinidia rufa TaxID=165716 RepID=A0A7J0EF68_9ERIC|nr:NAD(P)-linked oxidoreductase superfamily protein [Actinidia rufa]